MTYNSTSLFYLSLYYLQPSVMLFFTYLFILSSCRKKAIWLYDFLSLFKTLVFSRPTLLHSEQWISMLSGWSDFFKYGLRFLWRSRQKRWGTEGFPRWCPDNTYRFTRLWYPDRGKTAEYAERKFIMRDIVKRPENMIQCHRLRLTVNDSPAPA